MIANKALLLDFGGVLSVTMFERHALSEAALGLKSGTLTWRGPFDPAGDALWSDMIADRISERDYWARRAAEVGRLFGEDWDMRKLVERTRGPEPNRHIRPQALAFVDRVAQAGVRIGILSNELELFYGAETMRRLEILKHMHAIVDGTHTHILKPDSRAYALGCEALGFDAANVVFVDDQARNVKGAQEAGLEAVLFDVTRPGESFAIAAGKLGLQ